MPINSPCKPQISTNKYWYMSNSMPNQHKKMSTPSDFNETQEICSLPQDIMSHTIWYLNVVWLLNYRAVKI